LVFFAELFFPQYTKMWILRLSVLCCAAGSFLTMKSTECHQCFTDCNRDPAFNDCYQAYLHTCSSGLKALNFCRCEEGGWDYPYLNPGGRPAGERSWKCCFDHYCLPEWSKTIFFELVYNEAAAFQPHIVKTSLMATRSIFDRLVCSFRSL